MRVTTQHEIDELDAKCVDMVEVEIEWELTPGEPMVWRTPNGDGYPGSPDLAEIQAINITAAESDSFFFVRRQDSYPNKEQLGGLTLINDPGLLDSLLPEVEAWIEKHFDRYAAYAFELAADEEAW